MLWPMAPLVPAFVAAAILTPIVRVLATRLGVVALPADDRWHRRTIPMLGGVAIFASAACGVLVAGTPGADTLLIAGGATLMFGLGLIDDVFPLRPSTKLLGQVVVACAFTLAAGPTRWVDQPALDALITIGWIVAISNAFNLLDNMDGLCAGVAAIAAIAFCMGVGTENDLVRLSAALAGASAGFLLYNYHPARIFMGDCGSLVLGATLAMLTLRVGHRHSMGVVSALVFPVLLMLIPIFDTIFVTVTRKLSARSAAVGGRDHTSHRLVSLGFPEPTAVLLLYGFAAVAGAAAVLLTRGAHHEARLLTVVLLVGLGLLGTRLARVNVYGDADFILLRSRSITPLLIDVTYKRRIFEILLDFALVSIAYYGAYVLRFDRDLYLYYDLFVQSLPAVIACQLGGLYAAGVYRGTWRHISVYDVWTFGKGLVYGELASILVLVYLYRFAGYSRGVFVIDTLLAGVLVIGSRVAFRGLGELADRYREGGRRTAIYGAGDSGSQLARELRANATLDCRAVMFVDDNAAMHGKRILGVPILGGEAALADALATGAVEVVTVAAPIPEDRMARLAALCREHGVELLAWHAMLVPVVDSAGASESPEVKAAAAVAARAPHVH